MVAKKEQIWIARVISIKKGKEEKWIVSLVGENKKSYSSAELEKAIKSTKRINKNSEFWICKNVSKGKSIEWLCVFQRKGMKKPVYA